MRGFGVGFIVALPQDKAKSSDQVAWLKFTHGKQEEHK